MTSIVLQDDERRAVASAHADNLAQATGETVFLLPTGGCGEWDRPGADLNDPQGLAAFCEAFREQCPPNVDLRELDAHINDAEFADAALSVFDDWVKRGIVPAA